MAKGVEFAGRLSLAPAKRSVSEKSEADRDERDPVDEGVSAPPGGREAEALQEGSTAEEKCGRATARTIGPTLSRCRARRAVLALGEGRRRPRSS
jgi:hypothetical protein